MKRMAIRIEGEGENVIAYRGRAFLFGREDGEDEKRLVNEAETFLGMEGKLDGDTYEDLLVTVRENLPEALTGEVTDDGYLLMTSDSDYRHGRGSRLLQGLLRGLGLHGARMEDNYSGDTKEEFPAYKVTGRLPDALLHGTTSEHMLGILRLGLSAGESDSNYELNRDPENAIRHDDTVFLTDRPGKAAYHAVNAVHQLGARRVPGGRNPYSTRDAKAGFPVIVEFAVPDKSKLVPDYDIDVWSDIGEGSFGQTGRMRRKMQEKGYNLRSQEDPFKLSRRFGIFGYRGRIPASFIRSIKIFTGEDLDDYRPSDWISVTRKQLERATEFDDAAMWDAEDTCPECGEFEEDCECESAVTTASVYWRLAARLESSRTSLFLECYKCGHHDIRSTMSLT